MPLTKAKITASPEQLLRQHIHPEFGVKTGDIVYLIDYKPSHLWCKFKTPRGTELSISPDVVEVLEG